jgi:hypothetical protein
MVNFYIIRLNTFEASGMGLQKQENSGKRLSEHPRLMLPPPHIVWDVLHLCPASHKSHHQHMQQNSSRMDLIHQLSRSLKEDNSDDTRKRWAKHIIEHNIAILDLKQLIHEEHPVSMRFSWMLGGICESAPAHIFPAITYFFTQRENIAIKNFNRSLAKMLYLAGIPSEIEAKAIIALFEWLEDAHSDVSTKRFAILALYEYAKKQPQLVYEVTTSIEVICAKQKLSLHFQRLAKTYLEKLKALKPMA